ncbi:MAG: carbohydrate binding family 9 domain-containing protein, partial [bacterium]|nr:carbohydrate binding family 9 domain-containing protein [bacterium]
MTVQATAGEIKIDGLLDDAGWRGAGKADNFAEHRPGDQTRPPVDTRAYLTYDSDFLYAAFVCYDDPSTIRATLCDRDQNVGSDDNVALLLDTYGDASRSYELFVNPYGVQADALHSNMGGEDFSYDLVWKSAATITDSGYQVEMAIPFTSLRFPNNEQQTWRVDFWRNHPRDTRRQYSWAAYDRDDPCWPCKWGTVTGIADVQPGRGIEFLPSVVAYQSGALLGEGSIEEPFQFDNADPDGEVSVGVKYSISSDVMAEATYNPDFSQIESDAAQIDVNSTFALFYPERRPFFQEGSDLFNTIFNAVYTRSINNPEFAGKVTARKNRASVAYMVARDENSPVILPSEERSRYLATGKSTSNILRGRYSFGENSGVGFLATDRRLDGGGSGTLLSADVDLYFAGNYRLEWQAMSTYTQEPDDTLLTHDPDDSLFNSSTFDEGQYTMGFDGESFWGHAVYVGLSRDARNSYVDVSYLERSPTYRADNGFQPRNNQRSGRFYGQYVFRFDEGLLQTIVPSISGGRQWNFAGVEKANDVNLSLEFSLRAAQLSCHS